MNSLTDPRVADVIARLHQEAEAADQPVLEDRPGGAMADEDLIRRTLEEEARDYRSLYHRYADNYFSVSPTFGQFLYVCARTTRSRLVIEYGTSFGVSTLYLAAALRDNGAGHLVTTELEPAKAARAQENLAEAGLADLVDVRVGDALDTLRAEPAEPVDLLLLDGAFSLYLPVLRLVEPYLRPGALVVAENAIEAVSDYRDHVRAPHNGYLTLTVPFDETRGNELSLRTG
ncbi:methyltransferase [Actinoalloteichus sp. AHMU CJ021]|uniref:Methyltransferase domain-containing protein n=1 Tax=Actinoalloteichus caeruleus DSM 43889 TaxID=1120930 RepID=A0ABT1JDG2_ACTCY|nr:class I SAM-dependent methyltransferase [Actinoalloteichus caeruleus]AUS79454.1 methyltransferase [Actinoalloteichus sp. AHMU CJ021]MCP2330181.1 Methyltransferase domain-containing protein [Actinoalloteichus caeruleus DSM 43889]